MDMSLAYLLKHKIRFKCYEGNYGNVNYLSSRIEKLRNIGAHNLYELGLNQIQSFCLHVFSMILHECPHVLSTIVFYVNVIQSRRSIGKEYLIVFRIENPRNNAHLFSRSSVIQFYNFDDNVFRVNKPFFITVETRIIINTPTIMPDGWREEESDEEEPYTPPVETYRQDCCVVCLEAKPNILYLDCMHIAICDSCERVKSNASLQSTCDICRAEISRKIKI